MSGILILDTSYTLKMIKERNLYKALHSRKVGGYFKKVISVHPLSGLLETGRKRFGKPIISKIDSNHIFISGKIGINKFFDLIPPINFFLSQIKLTKLLINIAIKNNVRAIRIGDPHYLGLLGVVISKFLKVPLIIRVAANFDEFVRQSKKPIQKKFFRYRFIEKIVERFVFSRCHLIAGANQNSADYAIKNGAKKKLVTIFRYGNLIHPSHWTNPKNRKFPRSIPFILKEKKIHFALVISRLEKVKGIDSIIKAASELKKSIECKIKFLIIGDGSEMGYLKELSIKLDVSEDVIFMGNKDQVWISKILPFSLVVLSPHGGRSLTESCLAGVPIIAYDFEWQKELIKNNQTGFLIQNRNWMGFVEKIIYVLQNKKKSKLLGKNARALVLKMMNPKKLVKHEKLQYAKTIKNYNSKYILKTHEKKNKITFLH